MKLPQRGNRARASQFLSPSARTHHKGFLKIWKPRGSCILYVNCLRMNRIKVRVQFYAQLRDLIGIRELEFELPQRATVRELLEQIYAQQPALRAYDKSILIGAGFEFVDRNYILHTSEEIALMPPVQGG